MTDFTPCPQSVVPSNAQIDSAIKATEYKYFGDYEMSPGQFAAVDTLVAAAAELTRLRVAAPAPSSLAGGAVRGAVARLVDPTAWRFFDTALAPFLRNSGATGDEAWIYDVTYHKRGFRSADEVRSWLISGEPEPSEATATSLWSLRQSLAKADAILAALSPEAPAWEGAGEVASLSRYSPTSTGNNQPFMEEDEAGLFVRRKDVLAALRSSAPESLGNLLAVIHRDGGHRTLEVGVERAAAEAEKIVADLLSSAPEAREGEQPVAWVSPGQFAALKDKPYNAGEYLPVRKTSAGRFTMGLYAAPSADKLREDCK